MATYAQLEAEPWWGNEYEPPALADFNAWMREHYRLTKAQCGSKGDNAHLRGRHRSRTWTVNSAYCTSRTYGNTDTRDKVGPGNALRATDIGIFGERLWAASRAVDAAVRAGRLPMIAEWFGSFDGKSVVGWFQGGPSTSDSSHLSHLHLGYWTSYTNNAAQFELLGELLAGPKGGIPVAHMFVAPTGNILADGKPEKGWFITETQTRRLLTSAARAKYQALGMPVAPECLTIAEADEFGGKLWTPPVCDCGDSGGAQGNFTISLSGTATPQA